MNSRRIMILLVAVVAGAMASFAIYTYIGNVRTEATQGADMVEVWRVTEVIPKGTTANEVIERGFIVKDQVEASNRPLTAIDDPMVEIQGLVAVIDIPANVPLVEGLFVEPGVVATGITDRLAERGFVTITLNFDQVRGGGYMIEPGDRVNILSLLPRLADTAAAPVDPAAAVVDGAASPALSTYPLDAAYVYEYAEVLAVGASLISDLGAPADGTEGAAAAAAGNKGLITLAVPPEAVQIILNAGVENLYLSLVPQNFVPKVLPRMTIDEANPLFPAEREGELTPYWNAAVPETADADQ